MAGTGSSSGAGGGLSGASKVALLLAGGTVAGLIGWFLLPNGDDGDDPDPAPVVTQATREPEPAGGASAPAVPPASAPAQAFGVDRKSLTEGYPEGVLLTITAYGMPARVAPTFENEENSVFTRGMFTRDPAVACTPDTQYPDPCVSYWLVQSGTVATVTAGDSRAGYWPVLEAVHGPGCDLTGGGGQDKSCTITLAADVELVATYYGTESPGLSHYTYPTCPSQRGSSPPSWSVRCP